jgi:hypothetical protein
MLNLAAEAADRVRIWLPEPESLTGARSN